MESILQEFFMFAIFAAINLLLIFKSTRQNDLARQDDPNTEEIIENRFGNYCNECGATIEMFHKFCTNCGKEVRDNDEC